MPSETDGHGFDDSDVLAGGHETLSGAASFVLGPEDGKKRFALMGTGVCNRRGIRAGRTARRPRATVPFQVRSVVGARRGYEAPKEST
jgi:hypothetical protein